jgi:hypothetical protein
MPTHPIAEGPQNVPLTAAAKKPIARACAVNTIDDLLNTSESLSIMALMRLAPTARGRKAATKSQHVDERSLCPSEEGVTLVLWDNLTSAEAQFMQHVLQTLKNEPWAKQLVRTINDAGGITQANMPFLFEARVAYALHERGIKPDYEYKTDVGNSSVDFRIIGKSKNWLVEIVKIGESAAAAAATHQHGPYIGGLLKTPSAGATADEAKESPEGELLLAEQKIAEKVVSGRNPIKFPKPTAGSFHMIIIDMRAFLHGGDEDDYAQICYGAAGVHHPANVFNWPNPSTGKAEPIKGLFQPANPLRGAPVIQERVHFLGFVTEKSYKAGEISKVMRPFANPHLLGDEQEASHAWKTNPLRQINEG